ncbi:hypothetical protein OHB12_20925 [Nocardia sp. NBC_01730]|nr:hypothetical protein OHB12_20925 [Nocardia sp. NBC_01730]
MTGVHEELTAVGAFTGRHAIAEFEGIDPALLDDEELLRDILGAR